MAEPTARLASRSAPLIDRRAHPPYHPSLVRHAADAFVHARSLDDVVRITAEHARTVAHASRCTLYSANGEATEVRGESIADGAPSGAVPSDLLGSVARDRAAWSGLLDFTRPAEDRRRTPDQRSSMLLPLMQRGRVTAIVAVIGRPRAHFGLRDLDLLRQLCLFAEVAMERSASAAAHGPLDDATRLDQLASRHLEFAVHEMRGPLTVMRGYADMLADGSLGHFDADVAAVHDIVRRKAEELGRLVNEMLENARAAEQHRDLTVVPMDLRLLVQDVCRDVYPVLNEQHQLVVESPAEPVMAAADPASMRVIVLNLVRNAIKYSPRGGVVRIRVCRSRIAAQVRVSDEGVGIHRDDRARLFTRFGRIHTAATESIPGTGLGLYLSRLLARRQGGNITCRSAPDVGSTFTLAVPFAVGAH